MHVFQKMTIRYIIPRKLMWRRFAAIKFTVIRRLLSTTCVISETDFWGNWDKRHTSEHQRSPFSCSGMNKYPLKPWIGCKNKTCCILERFFYNTVILVFHFFFFNIFRRLSFTKSKHASDWTRVWFWKSRCSSFVSFFIW